jgi:hypothetical protein
LQHIKIDAKIESSEGNKLGITLKGDDTLIGVAGFRISLKITEPKLVISYIHLIAVRNNFGGG